MQKIAQAEKSNLNQSNGQEKKIDVRVINKKMLPDRISGNITITLTS